MCRTLPAAQRLLVKRCPCVQLWLCDVEKVMRSTLKDVLFRCLNALKKASAHREKWLTEWPGQVRSPAQTAPQTQQDLHHLLRKTSKRRGRK